MVKVLVFLGIFGQGFQWQKFWSFWPRLLLLATLAMNTNGQSYLIWFAFEQPRVSRSAKQKFVFARGNHWHPAVQTRVCAPEGNCWHGFEVQLYSYTSTQLMARKYKYIRTMVGKVLTDISEQCCLSSIIQVALI